MQIQESTPEDCEVCDKFAVLYKLTVQLYHLYEQHKYGCSTHLKCFHAAAIQCCTIQFP